MLATAAASGGPRPCRQLGRGRDASPFVRPSTFVGKVKWLGPPRTAEVPGRVGTSGGGDQLATAQERHL